MEQDNIYKLRISDIPIDELSVNYTDSDMVLFDIDNLEKAEHLKSVELGFNVFLVCYEGKMQGDIDGRTITLHNNQLLVCPSYAVLDDFLMSPDMKCIILCLSDSLLKSVLHSYTDIWNKAIYVHKLNIIDLRDKSKEKLHSLFTLVKSYVEDDYVVYRSEIVHSLLQAALLDLCSLISYNSNSYSGKISQSGNIFNMFIDLIAKSDVKRHPVAFYADALCISTKYLTRICKDSSGKTALEWIQEYVNDDITYFMQNANMNIKMIADRTGFPNMSAFGKYVRKVFGASPSVYRRKLLMK